MKKIKPQSAITLKLSRNEVLHLSSPYGGQTCDLVAFVHDDVEERLSGSHTFVFEETTQMGLYSRLWSNRANALLTIVEDTIEQHDLQLPPCSQCTKAHFNEGRAGAQYCCGALGDKLAQYGVRAETFDATFSVFTNIWVDEATGSVLHQPTEQTRGGRIRLRAETDLLIALSTCNTASAPANYTTPPVVYNVEPPFTDEDE